MWFMYIVNIVLFLLSIAFCHYGLFTSILPYIYFKDVKGKRIYYKNFSIGIQGQIQDFGKGESG